MLAFDAGGKTIAVDPDILSEDEITRSVNGEEITIRYEGEQVLVISNGDQVSFYWEMWFSWFVHHAEGGLVWD